MSKLMLFSIKFCSSSNEFQNHVKADVRPGADFSNLPRSNSAGFCSTRGVGSGNRVRIAANGLRAVTHRLFAAVVGRCLCNFL